MALELLRHALVSLLVPLVVHAPGGATRAHDELQLEMVTSTTVASCASWRLGVETNNIRGWYSIPAECRSYVRDYMYGDLFRQDCAVVAGEAAAYAEGLELGGDGKEVWVFDVDDTTLTNLPYYADTGFGAEPYNATYFDEYVANATAPALPEVQELYEKLLWLGIKVVFITGRHDDDEKEATIKNLRSAGYHTWEKLVLNWDFSKAQDVIGGSRSSEVLKAGADLGGVILLEPGVKIRCAVNKQELCKSLLCGGQELEEVIVFVDLNQEEQRLDQMGLYFRWQSAAD